MTNITALLLALTLTGTPVASVVCVTECQHRPVSSGHCHADVATSEAPMVSATGGCADPSIGEGPYLIEHRAAAGAAVLTTTSSLTMPEVARTAAPAVRVRPADAWLKPSLILRI